MIGVVVAGMFEPSVDLITQFALVVLEVVRLYAHT
jgi:hypothetical protein